MMIKKLYRPLAILTAVIIAASLAKGASLAQISATFPEGGGGGDHRDHGAGLD